jgi:hypothetical protein
MLLQPTPLTRRTTTVADPTDQDLLELMPETMRDEFGYAAKVCSNATGGQVKPPSLKEQALTALHAVATGANDTCEQHQDLDTIRRALEALDA